MACRRAAVLAGGYPHLVAERNGQVVGYTYASSYRPRPACRFAVENSVYVAPGGTRGGTGRVLLDALVAACTARGFRLMVAVIGDSANYASIGLHECAGFARAGRRLEARALGGQRADDPRAGRRLDDSTGRLTRPRKPLSCGQ